MIDKIVSYLSIHSSCQFELIESASEAILFYKSKSPIYQRFLTVITLGTLIKPSELNELVLLHTPQSFIEEPGFSKNTDVIIIFKISDLDEISDYEEDIFSLEEDSYSFKKHVLYYSGKELELINSINIDSIYDLIKDQSKFKEYKQNPFKASIYSIICRIFIKLPFLSVPVDESELDEPCIYADNDLRKARLFSQCQNFERTIEQYNSDYTLAVKEYIRGKMANSSTED
ncbi:ABC-three component system middle component 1 [Aeromonas hydrophila]